MAAALSVIVTDHAAITQSVKHGINGFIVKKKDPVQLAEAILKLVSDQNLRSRMGKESRRLYEEGFTEDRMVGRLGSAIRQTLGN